MLIIPFRELRLYLPYISNSFLYCFRLFLILLSSFLNLVTAVLILCCCLPLMYELTLSTARVISPGIALARILPKPLFPLICAVSFTVLAVNLFHKGLTIQLV